MAGEVTLVDLVKRFGDVAAVDGINLEMPSGEFFSMLGPSGCGKTTTLRMIAGFEQPTEGRILLDGNDMWTIPFQDASPASLARAVESTMSVKRIVASARA